jgi:serine/threonine-protein kinase RsbW
MRSGKRTRSAALVLPSEPARGCARQIQGKHCTQGPLAVRGHLNRIGGHSGGRRARPEEARNWREAKPLSDLEREAIPMAVQALTRPRKGTFVRSFPGERGQVRLVRAAAAPLLEGCPAADDAVLITSELAANAAVHSRSAVPGGLFTVRIEVHDGDYVWIEVEDQGGRWSPGGLDDGCPHGLDLVDALAGSGNWGIDGDDLGRAVWARLDLAGALTTGAPAQPYSAGIRLPLAGGEPQLKETGRGKGAAAVSSQADGRTPR